VINDPEQFHQFSDFCQSDLKSRIHQDKSEDSDHLTDTAKKFLNFIEKLISEQGGGTDLEIHFLESRCKELLGVPLDQYKDTTNQLVNQKIISARRTPDGDFYYDVDKRRIRELTDGEQQHDFFRKWEQLIGRE
jgi:hypothetical protein